jgi:hypothetical protein
VVVVEIQEHLPQILGINQEALVVVVVDTLLDRERLDKDILVVMVQEQTLSVPM